MRSQVRILPGAPFPCKAGHLATLLAKLAIAARSKACRIAPDIDLLVSHRHLADEETDILVSGFDPLQTLSSGCDRHGMIAATPRSWRRPLIVSVDVCSAIRSCLRLDRSWRGGGSGSRNLEALFRRSSALTRAVVISGPLPRFIKTVGGVVTLTNNHQFVISNSALVPISAGSGPPPSHFVPPRNVMRIASNKFAEGSGRIFVKSFDDGGDHTALWSGPKGSAIGTIRCADAETCRLEHLILASPYRIRNFRFVPPPHPEMSVGSLWFWTTLRPGEEALVGYTFLLRTR